MAHGIRMSKSNVGGMIGAEARAANCDAMGRALTPGKIENVMYDHVFVSIVGPHPIGRMNGFVVKALKIDRVRAIDRDFARIDIGAYRTDEAEILVLIITAK